jgi:hypothetical protein
VSTGVPITDIVLGTSTAFSAALAAWALWFSRKDTGKKATDDQIFHRLAPLNTKIEHVEQSQRDLPEQLIQRMEGLLAKALDPVRNDITALNTKIEPLWAVLLQLAKDQADFLHHPDPTRVELDALLDHYKADTLTPDETLLLRRYLNQIKNWTGEDLGYNVYPGEPTNASILLRIMELTSRSSGSHK